MNAGTKRRTATALAVLFLAACPVMAADPGGSSSESEDSSAMTYITIGIAVVIGGLLALDVIYDSDEDEKDYVEPEHENVETGVDWDAVFPLDAVQVSLAVSVFRGENGTETAREFIGIIENLAPENCSIYPEPVDLGEGPAVERARMAMEFFNADYLILDSGNLEFLQLQAFTPDSAVWTSPEEPGISIIGIVENLLQAGVL